MATEDSKDAAGTTPKSPAPDEVDTQPLQLKFKELSLEFDGRLRLPASGGTTIGKSSPVCNRALYAGWVEVDPANGALKGRLHNIFHLFSQGLGEVLSKKLPDKNE